MSCNRLYRPICPVSRPLDWTHVALLSAILLAACASTPKAPPELALAEAAVQRANTPATAVFAPTELRIATDKLSAARAAVISGNTDRARMLSEQAEIDARVAELHAEVVRSSKAAKQAEKPVPAIPD